MAAVLEVVLKARDELTGVLKTSELNTRQLAQTASKMKVALEAAFAVGASLAAVAAIRAMTTESIRLGDQIDRTAKLMQISTDEAQRWDYVAKQSGSSAEIFAKGIQSISKNAYEANRGMKTYTDAFEALGIQYKDTNGNLKTSEDLFRDSVFALADMQDKTKQAALAQTLLGRAGRELIPVLSQGKQAIIDQLNETEKYGLILSESAIAKLDAADDAMYRFNQSMKVAKAEIIANGIPALTELGNTLSKLTAKISDAAIGWSWMLKSKEQNEKDLKALDTIKQEIKALGELRKEQEDIVTWNTARKNKGLWYDSDALSQAQSNIQSIKEEIQALNAEAQKIMRGNFPALGSSNSTETVTDFSGSGDKKDHGIDAYKRMSQEASENAREMFEFTTEISEASRNWAYEDARIRFEAKQNADKQILKSEQVLQDTRIAMMADGTEKELALLDVKYERMKAGYEGNVTALANIDKAYAEERKNITDAVTKRQLEASRNQTQAMIGNLRDVATQWKQFAGVYKAIAIAQTIWDTYSSAQSSYKAMAGIPYVGPALGVAAAAAAVAAGLANIAQIKAARFALGGDFITRGPTPIIVGDNAGGVERVQITPISSPNINGPQGGSNITIQVYDQSGGLVEATRSKIRSGEYDSAIRDIMSRYGMMS